MPPPASANVVTQVGTLIVTAGRPDARLSQLGSLVITTANPLARVTQTGVLVVAERWAQVTVSHFTNSALTPMWRSHTTDCLLPGGGLVSWWKLDETTLGPGGTVIDSGPLGAFTQDVNNTSQPSSTAPIAAPVKFTNPRGRFFPFNSTYLSAFHTHNYTRNYTVSAWVRAVNVINTPIVSHQDPGTNGWGLGLINAKATFSAYRGGVAYSIASLDPLFNVVANTWTHVAIVTTVNNRYVYTRGNRAEVTSTELPGDSVSQFLYIGRDFPPPSGFILFQGDLDDIRIYNKALTSEQIQTLAYGTSDPFSVTPVAKIHTTSIQLRYFPWHYTDALVLLTPIKTHLTNAVLLRYPEHDTSAAIRGVLTCIHSTSTVILGNLVGYWKFDEVGSGQIALDSSPLAANAPDMWGSTVNSFTAPIAAPTHFLNPRGRYFAPPPNNWFNAGVQPYHGATQNFTVACWVRMPSTGAPLVTHQNAPGTNRGWGLMVSGPGGPARALGLGVLAFQSCTASGISVIGADAPLPVNTWVHVAAVVSTTNIRLFVSGKKQSAIQTVMPAASTDLPTYIGRDYSGTASTNQFTGDMDEVRIYRVALTDDQISTLADGGEPFDVTVVTQIHLTNTLITALVTTVTKTHTTNTLIPTSVIKTHLTNSKLLLMVEKIHTTDCGIILPPATAVFVQRDNWRNGTWINQYGSQGYAVYGSGVPDLMPTGISYTISPGTSSAIWFPPGVHADPRYAQVPGQPANTVAAARFSEALWSISVLFNDNLPHALSLFDVDFDHGVRQFHVNVYDANTNTLLDGPRSSGNYYVTGVYLTWNVKGYVRFEFTIDVGDNSLWSALFIDPPRSVVGVTHTTNSMTVPPVGVPVTVTHTTSANLLGKLVAWWKLDEAGTGQVAVDSSPLGANATDTLGTTVDAAPVLLKFTNPRSRRFSGDATYLHAGVQAVHGFRQNFTVACWFRTTAHQDMPLVCHQTYGDGRGWGLMFSGFGTPIFQVGDANDVNRNYADDPIPFGVWVHIAVVCTTSQNRMYINGKSQDFASGYLPESTPDLPTYIGRYYSDTDHPTDRLNGDLDDIRLYNVALTADQIQTLAYGTIDPFAVTPTSQIHKTNTSVRARSATEATFVQRDDWRNGQWIGQYGSQGYAVFGSQQPDLMPSGVSYTLSDTSLFLVWVAPGVNADPRYAQVPGQPSNTVAAAYYPQVYSVTFTFTDGKDHAVSSYHVDFDSAGARHFHINVYDADTNALLDGPRYSGNYATNGIYFTWNVRGRVRFDIINDNYTGALLSALFVDPPRSVSSVSHRTDSVLTGRLIGWWKLDESGTGQVAIDSSPTGANATDASGISIASTPAPVLFTNPRGRAIDYPTFLDTGVQPAHSLTQNFTVAGWVRNTRVDFATVISHTAYPFTRGWALLLMNNGVASFQTNSSGGNAPIYDYNNPAEVGVWVHLAGVVYDNHKALFVNGRKVTSGASGEVPDPSPDLPTYVGKWCSGENYYGYYSQADFDDIRIYNVALTDDQIQSLAGGILDPFTVTPTIQTHTTNSSLLATKTCGHTTDCGIIFPPATAVFVQRDNWKNGLWIGHYGTQGYAIGLGEPDVMPPGVSYSHNFAITTWYNPNTYTDPRMIQIPSRPGYSGVQVWYGYGYVTGRLSGHFIVLFDDGLPHAVSFVSLDTSVPPELQHAVNVYDNDTGLLLDGPRETGFYADIDVYLTWNVSGHVRFDIINQSNNVTSIVGMFIDPPRSVGGVTHSTSSSLYALTASASFVQRDNWRNGLWIDHYGAQGYSVFGSGVPDLMPPSVSYSAVNFPAGYYHWAEPGPSNNDPRLPQVPGQPGNTVGYLLQTVNTGYFSFVLEDDHTHAVSIFHVDVNHTNRLTHVEVRDDATGILLDGPRSTGDYDTTGVYQTWNVHGRVRFNIFADIANTSTLALFIDPPRSVGEVAHATSANLAPRLPATATFVQRDNWRNGFWIDAYGSQGVWVVSSGVPVLMPPGVTFSYYNQYGIDTPVPPGVYTDPRYYQVPGDPVQTVYGRLFSISTMSFVFLFDDSLAHSVSISFSSPDTGRLTNVEVYDNDTSALLDASRSTGNYQPTDVYMTWNVTGHVRVDVIVDYAAPVVSAVFVDPPRSVGGQTHTTNSSLVGSLVRTHHTDAEIVVAPTVSFVQRDNWLNGTWIGTYGTQGYAVFGSEVPDLMPPASSYAVTALPPGFFYNLFAPPAPYGYPQMPQVPGQPGNRVYATYLSYDPHPISYEFYFDDDQAHAVSLHLFSWASDPDRRMSVNVVDLVTDVVLDGPRDSGDFRTTSVYLTWNVRGHVRFDVFKTVAGDSNFSVDALFVEPAKTVVGQIHTTNSDLAGTLVRTHKTNTSVNYSTSAVFVQRDNWLGGSWVDQYGSQGYAVFLSGAPDLMPPGVSYRVAGGQYSWWLPPGTYTDPRLPQVPDQPGKTVASVYQTDDVECFIFNFADGLEHAVSIFSVDYDLGTRRHQIEVVDDFTGELLDPPRDVGDQYTNSVYMTWNVKGRIRFLLIDTTDGAIATALFIDPPMSIGSVTHTTDSSLFVGRSHQTNCVIAGHDLVASRSRTQRVGTRTPAFGEFP